MSKVFYTKPQPHYDSALPGVHNPLEDVMMSKCEYAEAPPACCEINAADGIGPP
jgi:hypothetical protein